MTWETLAPWIAIAFTLALSILVPLFTQIANNRHQRKMLQEQFEREQKQKKVLVYEEFLTNVGAVITYGDQNNMTNAGSSIQKMYIYAPLEWRDDLDRLFDAVRRYEGEKASAVMKKLSRLVSDELKKD